MADYISDLQKISNNMLDLANSVHNHNFDYDTLESNEKIALAQLDLAEKQYYSNVDIMNRNFGLQQQAFNYNKQQAELTRMREDNAFQRRVADVVKAGFSPLAAQGVASSNQSPVLTAPQLDPQGVNQAVTNRLNAYNAKMQDNNTKEQLRLQSQQIKLAQIETITETLSAVQNLRSQNIINQKNLHELKWYKDHGYRDTTLNTLLSDILKGVNVNGKSLGQLGSDAVNFTLDKLINSASLKLKNLPTSKPSQPVIKATDSEGNQINETTFYNTVSSIEKLFKKGDGTDINVSKLRRLANNIGWKGPEYVLPDNAKKLSPNTYYSLRDSFNKYLEEFNKLSPEFKNNLIDKYIKLWSK